MATTFQNHDNHEWTLGGIFLSFVMGVAVVAALWLFTGLLIGLFFI